VLVACAKVTPPSQANLPPPPEAASGIPVHCACDRLVDVTELVPNPRNPNKHGDKQIKLLAKIIRHQGWRAPIVVSNQSGFIVTGHGRYQAARLLNVEQAPVNYQDFKTPADEYAHLVADNRIAELAELDNEPLRDLLNELSHKDFDLELTGFDGKFLEKLNREDEAKPLGAQTTADIPSELPGAQALKSDMVFPSSAKYGIPEIRKDMLLPIPDNFETFAGWENINGHSGNWLYIWATDVLRGLDFTKTVVGFYADDYRFECFWDKPAEYTAKLLNARVLGAIGPNYSLWSSFPTAVKIWNTYRARWVTRYFQEAGIKVIPDVNHAEEASFDYCLEGIPKNAPALAVQVQTADKNIDEIVIRRKALTRIVNELLPDSLLLYVGLNYEPIIEGAFPPSLKVCVLRNRLQRRAESIRENTKKLEKTSSAHKD
jgi:uncharacterized protein DUF4417/ParB-like nuclease family protein